MPHNIRRGVAAISIALAMSMATTGTMAQAEGDVASASSQQASDSESHQLEIGLMDESGRTISLDSAEAQAILARMGPSEHMTSGKARGQELQQTMWTVGAGWSLYVYLNHGDINWLLGLGYTAASAAICALLVETIAGAVICAVAAYAIWSVIVALKKPYPAGYCREVKLSYAGNLKGSKWVKRSC